MPQSVLSVQSLSSGYDKKNVVENVSFEVGAGEIFGLVGLNGAGKTTLIKTILGLREKTAGAVILEKNKISYLPERFDPPWFLSGYNFIRFSLKLYKKDITKEEAQKAAETVSLAPEALDRNVQTYSKGMRQKLGLLATLLSGCPLLILDEPMSGLDPKARQEVKRIILDARAQGRSIFMSSHILADISELCDKVAVFHNKSVIFQGTPADMQKKGGNDNLEKAFLALLEPRGDCG